MELSDRNQGLDSLSEGDSEISSISRRNDIRRLDSPSTSYENEDYASSVSNSSTNGSNVNRMVNGIIPSKREVLNMVHHLALTKSSSLVQKDQASDYNDERRMFLTDTNSLSYVNGSITQDKNVNVNLSNSTNTSETCNSNNSNREKEDETACASSSCLVNSRETQINGNVKISEDCQNETVNVQRQNGYENDSLAHSPELNGAGRLPWREPSATNDVLSPDMDFLEFDFEEQNASGDEARSESSDESRQLSPQLENDDFVSSTENKMDNFLDVVENNFVLSLSCHNFVSSAKYHNNCLRPSARSSLELCNTKETCSSNSDSDSANLEACGKRLLRRESSLFNIPNEAMECEECNLQSALLCSFNSKLTNDKRSLASSVSSTNEVTNKEKENSNSNSEVNCIGKTMIWSEMEACTRQVTQIGMSACGATAVINVLMALNIPHDKASIKDHIHTRFRAETAPIAQYLISRSTAGTTHEELIQGVHKITNGAVHGRFFHMFPARDFCLVQWLSSWIAKGAVPIATLNLQRGLAPGQSIPDAWHHQMVFGVGPKGVYLTNPLECISATQIEQQTCSESVLLVRRNDVIGRWDADCDLSPLIIQGPLWRELNVVGQVVNVLREAMCPWVPGYRRYLTSHVKIPAVYKSGVTLFVSRDSEIFNELASSPELSIIEHNKISSTRTNYSWDT